MAGQYGNEPMMEMFLFETSQLLEQLEQLILTCEKSNCYTEDTVNEIFRIMHTIKGSSAMMMQDSISTISHSMEDLFYFLRESKPQKIDNSALSDLVLEGVDLIKIEVEKLKNGDKADGNTSELQGRIKSLLSDFQMSNSSSNTVKDRKLLVNKEQQYYLSQDKTRINTAKYKNAFKATIHFEEGCEMENIRAYEIVHNIRDITDEFFHIPERIIEDDSCAEIIRQEGFKLFLRTDSSYEELHEFFMETLFLKDLELVQIEIDDYYRLYDEKQEIISKNISVSNRSSGEESEEIRETHSVSSQQNIISVNMTKLDKLMDLVGEMVIAEDMVIQNPDLKGMELENFQKASRQLQKITGEI